MKRAIVLMGVVAFAISACQQFEPVDWFDGDLAAAKAEAEARDTVIMVEFHTEWCSWCRRLNQETFSDSDVRHHLNSLVSMRLDAEKEGVELAEYFEVDSYPTMVFLDSSGYELDRVIGYLPPEKFMARVERVAIGDTFLACLRQLEEDPGSVDAIERSVFGLLERSDPEGAISRIEAFHRANEDHDHALCRQLMFAARTELHARVFERASKLYLRGWNRGFAVPDTVGTATLHGLLRDDLSSMTADEQATLLRNARKKDAAAILEIPDLDASTPRQLLQIADFAYRNGHYRKAAEIYSKWYEIKGENFDANSLNVVAWRLYLAEEEIETALSIAREAHAIQPDADISDTLARLLYVSGSVDEAIALELRAADEAEGPRGESYRGIADRMMGGEVLDDEPAFDSYPGTRRLAL